MKTALRKIAYPMLAILLVIATTGLSVHRHFCNGMLVSQSVTHEPGNCCDDPDCCRNETVYLHLDTNFFVPAKVSLSQVSGSSISPVFLALLSGMISSPARYKVNLARQFTYLLPETSPPITGNFLL